MAFMYLQRISRPACRLSTSPTNRTQAPPRARGRRPHWSIVRGRRADESAEPSTGLPAAPRSTEAAVVEGPRSPWEPSLALPPAMSS